MAAITALARPLNYTSQVQEVKLTADHSPIAPCKMAMGERFKAGRAVSMVASDPTVMIGNPHIRKNCQGKTTDRLCIRGQ